MSYRPSVGVPMRTCSKWGKKLVECNSNKISLCHTDQANIVSAWSGSQNNFPLILKTKINKEINKKKYIYKKIIIINNIKKKIIIIKNLFEELKINV